MRTSSPRHAAGATGMHGAATELIRLRQRTLLHERLLLELELAHQTQTVHHEEESWGHLLQAQEVLAELCADDTGSSAPAELPDDYGLLRRELMRAAAARDTALIRSCLDLAEPLTGSRSRVA
jgi:hypothetical protein